MIKPDGFPDFYHTYESTCKNKGADGTARALRVIPAFNKVEGLEALNIIYGRLVNKANFDNLKVYSVFKYRAKNHAL